MQREYRVLFKEVEDGWIMATAPEVPGAVTQGKDMEDARLMIKDAIELLLETRCDNAEQEAGDNSVWEQIAVDVPQPVAK